MWPLSKVKTCEAKLTRQKTQKCTNLNKANFSQNVSFDKDTEHVEKLPFGPSGRAQAADDGRCHKKKPISNFRSFEPMLIFQNIQTFPNFPKAYLAQFLRFDNVLGHFGKVLKSSNQCL